ncbi:MAG: ABC transporter permease [Chloroflexi bacterium]|nr:ABC transporter permease [Chloroflexota bacterium]MDA1147212.1 ABC transporter permease [Chloroflexota bacterium]
MGTYILRRLILNIIVLWLVATMVFLSIRVLPGNYASQQFAGANLGGVTPEAIAQAEKALGLDKPVGEQYVNFMGDLLTLDLGESFRTRKSTWSELATALPYSLELGLFIVLVGFSVAIPVGVVSAVKQDLAPDYILRAIAITALAAPVFWTASIAVLFVLKWDLIQINVTGQPHYWTDPWSAFQWYLIPGVVGGFASTATVMRLLRSELLEVLRQDYVRTARAKGLTERAVIMRHAMRNAFLPVLTVMGLTLATLISSQIVLEQMFNIPGVGRMLFRSISLRDYPLFQGLVIVTTFVIVTTNLAVDVLYGFLDPRVRLS